MSVIGIIVAILIFCVLIIGHEFGHFASAKYLGVKVQEFSMGMGPLLWHKQKGETQYSLRAVPIGGFCRLEGEDGDEDKSNSRSFANQPAWSKIIILVMGSFMNMLLGILILTGVFMYLGSYSDTIASVMEGYPAAEAGILPGDRLVSVDGQECGWTEFVEIVSAEDGSRSLDVTVWRNGENLTFSMIPMISEDEGRAMLGVTCKVEHSFGKSLKQSLAEAGVMFVSIKEFLVNLVSGRVRSDDVVGVVGVMAVAGEQAQYGIYSVIYLMGIISFNLALVNMLPFPALDGGRVLFIILRKITGDRIGEKAEAIVNAIGFALLMILMVYLIIKDTFTFIIH